MNRQQKPTYYQGKFMSDQSVTGLSYHSMRPAMFGTLTAADAASRGCYQLPAGRSALPGIVSKSSYGIFNLPRYYPTYDQFDNEDDDDVGSTWRSGQHQKTIPFYRDQPVDDEERFEPIYAKPNKAARRGPGGTSNVIPVPREQFTVALGSDFDTSSSGRRHCCGRCCNSGCCRKRRVRRRICFRTILALIFLAIVAAAVAVFLAVFLVITKPTTGLMPEESTPLEAIQVEIVLRVDTPYLPVYSNLSADVTRSLTDKFCTAFKDELGSINVITTSNMSTVVGEIGHNCTAISYTNGSTIASFSVAFVRTSPDIGNTAFESAISAQLNRSLGNNDVFYNVLNATVSLDSLRLDFGGQLTTLNDILDWSTDANQSTTPPQRNSVINTKSELNGTVSANDTVTNESVTTQSTSLRVQVYVVLRVNSPYLPVYSNLSADVTRSLTDKFCTAFKDVLGSIKIITTSNSSTVVGNIANNCTATSYTNGSTMARFSIACVRTSSDVENTAFVSAISAQLNRSLTSDSVFHDVLNASVSLDSVRVVDAVELEFSSSRARLTTRSMTLSRISSQESSNVTLSVWTTTSLPDSLRNTTNSPNTTAAVSNYSSPRPQVSVHYTTSTAKSVTTQSTPVQVQVCVVLRVNSPYLPVYSNLSADATRSLTNKFCTAFGSIKVITTSNTSTEVGNIGNNCTATSYTYTNNSTVASFWLPYVRTSADVDNTAFELAISAQLNRSLTSDSVFHDVLNASVSLDSVRVVDAVELEFSSSRARLTTRSMTLSRISSQESSNVTLSVWTTTSLPHSVRNTTNSPNTTAVISNQQ